MSQQPPATPPASVQLPYQSPTSRARDQLKRTAIDTLIAWLIVALTSLVAFLQVGNFGPTALKTLALALAVSFLTALVAYLRKLASATGDDQPPTVPPAAIPAVDEITH